jgi:hypothetical protein
LGGPAAHLAYCQFQDMPMAYVLECHLALRPINNEIRRLKVEQERKAQEGKR